MKIKSILAGAAIALAATIGSASADEAQFSILGGTTATPMTQAEMAVVIGAAVQITTPGGHVVIGPDAAEGGAVTAFTANSGGPGQGFGEA